MGKRKIKKLQSFFLLKFSSDYLRDNNFNIKKLSLEDSRLNGQCIRLSDSELLRCIRRIRKSEYSSQKLEQLLEERGNILSKKDRKEYRELLVKIESKIDDLLFISDIISVKFSDTRHYAKIIKNGGILLNGKRYVRLLCSSGNARQNTVLFCNDEIIEEVRYFLNCGRNLDYKINRNKFNSYIALAGSASHPVSFPIFIVIPDAVIEREMVVDQVIESPKGKDAIIEETKIIQKFNLFDGMGIISPEFGWQWATDDLNLSYLPASFIFRAAYAKGLITVFCFKELARQNNIIYIKDIYGKEHFVDDIDLILTESQFKLVDAYENIDQYREEMKKRSFSFGISRVSPEIEKDTANLCYQYIQCLAIQTDEDIKNICADSVSWLKNVSFDQKWMLFFLLGNLTKTKLQKSWFDKLSDPILKSLLLEPNVSNDDYIRTYIGRLVRKIEKETFKGTLRVNANYQFVVADPYSLAQHALGLPITGLLEKGQSYSSYWNKRGIKEVVAFRSPTTGKSEPTSLSLKISFDLDLWYKYQTSNIVFNIFDDTATRLSGCDFDGDLILTTPHLNKYVFGGNIPYYERKTAEKEPIIEDELWKNDAKSFGSKVGLLTNFSSTIFSMLPLFKKGSEEEKILTNRIKIATAMQSQIIDSQKGIQVMPFPQWWADRPNQNEESLLTEEEKDLYKKVRITKRPYFFRHVYNVYAKLYKKHLDIYENLCQIRLGHSLNETLEKESKTEKERELINNFYLYSPLLRSLSIMNNVCRYMEKEVGDIRRERKNPDFDWKIYFDDEIELDEEKLKKVHEIYKEYSKVKKGRHNTNKINLEKDETINLFRKKLFAVSSNLAELTNLCIITCYRDFPKRSKDFCWKLMFGGIIFNLTKNNYLKKIELPLEDEKGGTEYLGKHYSFYDIDIL